MAVSKRDGLAQFKAAFPGAIPMWTAVVNHVGKLHCFALSGQLVIVEVFLTGGWDVFITANGSGLVTDTLDAVAARTAVPRADR